MSVLGLFSRKDKTTVINGAVKLVGNIRSMIDDSKLTHEEAMKANIEIADKMSDFVGDTLSENTERSKTRRSIAVFYMYFFCGLILLIIGLWKYDKAWAEFIKGLILELNLGTAFLAVIGFFFGSYMFRQYVGQNKKK